MNTKELMEINLLLDDDKFYEIYNCFGEDKFFEIVKYKDSIKILKFMFDKFKNEDYIYDYILSHINSFNRLFYFKKESFIWNLINFLYDYNRIALLDLITKTIERYEEYNDHDLKPNIICLFLSEISPDILKPKIHEEIFNIIFNRYYFTNELLVQEFLNRPNSDSKNLDKISICIKNILNKNCEYLVNNEDFLHFIFVEDINIKFINNDNVNLFKYIISSKKGNLLMLLRFLSKCEERIKYVEKLIFNCFLEINIEQLKIDIKYNFHIKEYLNEVDFEGKEKIQALLKLNNVI